MILFDLQSDSVTFDQLPFPPKISEAYDNRAPKFNPKTGRMSSGRKKSGALRVFQSQIETYRWKHLRDIENATKFLLSKGPECLFVEFYFVIQWSRVFTKKETTKKIDASNHIKAMEDGLSTMLDIDDRHFFSVVAHKIPSQSESEYVIARVYPSEFIEETALRRALNLTRV